jgi:hypothetical protein
VGQAADWWRALERMWLRVAVAAVSDVIAARSCSVKRLSSWPQALQSASTVRSAALLSGHLNLAKSCQAPLAKPATGRAAAVGGTQRNLSAYRGATVIGNLFSDPSSLTTTSIPELL